MHTNHSHRHHNQLSLFQKARELPHRRVSIAAFSGESHVLQFFMLALALCVAGYLYFVGVSIMNVIAHREASVESDRLQSIVVNLEEEYFKLSKGVTPEMGAHLGLQKTSATSFVRRASGMASNVKASEI
ncbi:MAG: hypothetical protein Q8R25_01835 [bacterium]|nr:hypothetical protein [bacterium]